MPRIPLIDPASLSPEQQAVFDKIQGGARGRVGGPFRVLLHSPGAADVVQQVGEYLRFHSVLPERIRELVITLVARHWHADIEWNSHAPRAARLGVPAEVLEAIGGGEPPPFTETEDRIACAFVSAALKSSGMGSIPEEVLAEARAAFGEAGLIDLAVFAGYYTLLAMVLNTFEVRPEGADIPWRRGD
ncbi:carboxymuconolactone decarboxylase family protein [Propylenella binzhouense]|uniref:Carboxymuconolactone decarboxylase family protein n=1 Tax=Propylenella binzhouense TaxID=2555902 RepID=A0A964WT61_9HYPH|nr:carboxymuconolactone decarboxylase family protein [Propylenella binzhouense]MYZ47674.1 carboxymuconolactone decarboxylase family protein [Propylenella binzhouense]